MWVNCFSQYKRPALFELNPTSVHEQCFGNVWSPLFLLFHLYSSKRSLNSRLSTERNGIDGKAGGYVISSPILPSPRGRPCVPSIGAPIKCSVVVETVSGLCPPPLGPMLTAEVHRISRFPRYRRRRLNRTWFDPVNIWIGRYIYDRQVHVECLRFT